MVRRLLIALMAVLSVGAVAGGKVGALVGTPAGDPRGVNDASAPRPAFLRTCSTYLYATSGRSVCKAGAGGQHGIVTCDNTWFTFKVKGPIVGRGESSWAVCPHAVDAVRMSYGHDY